MLYLDGFDDNNMFEFEQKNILLFVSGVLKSDLYHRTVIKDLKYCDDAIRDLVDLTVEITDMIKS